MTFILASSAYAMHIPHHNNIYSQIMDNRKQLSDMQVFVNLTGVSNKIVSCFPEDGLHCPLNVCTPLILTGIQIHRLRDWLRMPLRGTWTNLRGGLM